MKNNLTGIIFFSKKIKDNDLYIRILSSNDEIFSGIVYNIVSYLNPFYPLGGPWMLWAPF